MLQDVHGVVREWLYLEDTNAIDVALGTVIANKLPGDSMATVLIGPSSSGKTEILRALLGHPWTILVSKASPASFLPLFYDAKKGGIVIKGILEELQDRPDKGIGHTMIIPEMSQVLNLPPWKMVDFFAQLRSIIGDGFFDRKEGTGKKSWQGKVGALAASTSSIERCYTVISGFGPRMVFYRMKLEDRDQMSVKARSVRGSEEQMRKEISEVFQSTLDAADLSCSVEIPLEYGRKFDWLANIVTWARTPVERDHANEQVAEAQPENPPRMAKTLEGLAAAITLLHGESTLTEKVYSIVHEVGLSSLPWQRLSILAALKGRALTVRQLREMLGPGMNLRYRTDDLEILGIVHKNGHEAISYTDEFAALWEAV